MASQTDFVAEPLGSERNAGYDLVRGLCALIVVFAHTEFWWNRVLGLDRTYFFRPLGFMAVEVFFVLSGLLLGPIILKAMQSGNVQNLVIFVARRACRTMPLYFLALFGFISIDRADDNDRFAEYFFFVQNLATPMPQFFSVSWSLSIEEWFYVLVPLMGICMMKFMPRVSSLSQFRLCMWILLVSAIVFRTYHVQDFQNWDQDVRKVVLVRLDALACGALLSSYALRKYEVVGWVAAIVLAILTAILGVWWDLINFHRSSALVQGVLIYGFLLVPLCTYFLVRSLGAWDIEGNRVLRFFADISYSLYLFHILALILVREWLGDSAVLSLFIYYLATVASAFVLHRYVEKPFIEARPNFK